MMIMIKKSKIPREERIMGGIIGKAQWVDDKLGKALELDVKVLE